MKRNARTIFTLEIGALASSLAYGSPLALPITLVGAIAVASVAIWTSEAENAAREREIRILEAERARDAADREPIRVGALSQVAGAASRVLRKPIRYRDVPAAQPRTADISVLRIARRESPEGGWTSAETRVIQAGIDELAREYGATIGAPVHELALLERRAAYAITERLEVAQDALDRLAMTADALIGAAAFESDSRIDRHNEAIAAFRAELQAAVRQAEVLLHAEHVAKGLENPIAPLLTP